MRNIHAANDLVLQQGKNTSRANIIVKRLAVKNKGLLL